MSKMQIKKKVEIKNEKLENSDQLNTLIKFILVIVAIFAAFYLITILVKKKNQEVKNTSDEETTISYSTILFSNLLSKSGEYYVLAVSDDDLSSSLYNAYLSTYSAKKESLDYYIADLDDTFNKGYISDKSNLKTDKVSELKVSKTTLFKIKNNKIASYYEGKDAIIEHLKSITK